MGDVHKYVRTVHKLIHTMETIYNVVQDFRFYVHTSVESSGGFDGTGVLREPDFFEAATVKIINRIQDGCYNINIRFIHKHQPVSFFLDCFAWTGRVAVKSAP